MSGVTRVYIDIEIGGCKSGRIVFELFQDKAPLSAQNFKQLCCGGIELDGKHVSFRGNRFHRVIKNFMVQAGDIMYGMEGADEENLGKGGCSIYSQQDEEGPCRGAFADENTGEFSEPFLLAMANMGAPDSNSSQFFITTTAAPHLNGKHSIFGQVIHGKAVVREIEKEAVDSDGVPEKAVRIAGCGEWTQDMPVPLYNACNDPIGGDIYEEYPTDNTLFGGEEFGKAYAAAVLIKESGTQLLKRKDFQNAFFKYRKSLNYVNEYIPDVDIDAEQFEKFNVLKQKLYLNMTLALFNMGSYDSAISYTNYVLEMDRVPSMDLAKAYYRRGNCYLAKNLLEEALSNYKRCKEHNSDEAVDMKIASVESKLAARLEKTKKSISKFFQ
ncbi:AEL062Cp [Eremothecium gossypii ATCC 10895]|uniref:peptidylprolyl isomerase n=1 Tax=Eremothecium gossypii (strain ATCC 10895 / CBS 109.51 / FGSC 9923 / NRRL Y-1056) TaxID=284811 RepID=Q757S4_EREGS|nr:AEL062Cp [Eremothecium gossypii ATCC 10895]AAS52623.1 AEL062Cp [Eremothecium gossypii ATCC 10895]AEY96927.1 FAEL062Cp [Eremothecium gossypii FDAG1]